MPAPRSEVRCERCDLPLAMCEHRPPAEPTSAEAWAWFDQLRRRTDRPVTVVREFFDTPAYRQRWREYLTRHESELIDCDHEKTDTYLCPGCTKRTKELLADLPALIYDLHLAYSRETAFVSHGVRRQEKPTEMSAENSENVSENVAENVSENVANVAQNVVGNVVPNVAGTHTYDESPLPFDSRVVRVRAALAVQLGCAPDFDAMMRQAVQWRDRIGEVARDPDAAAWAWRLSKVVSVAFSVVDRPPDLTFLGPCPGCRSDLWVERGADVDCQVCAYHATYQAHQAAALDLGEDAMLTTAELLEAVTSGGERVSRFRLNGWIRNNGLPRERGLRKVWVDGQLVIREVWTYRLGDVRAYAAAGDRRRSG